MDVLEVHRIGHGFGHGGPQQMIETMVLALDEIVESVILGLTCCAGVALASVTVVNAYYSPNPIIWDSSRGYALDKRLGFIPATTALLGGMLQPSYLLHRRIIVIARYV
jgi:hypothetical protein